METNIDGLSIGDNLVDLLMGTSFVILMGGCGLWMGEACRIEKNKLRMFGRLTMLCMFMNFLLVSSIEMTSMLVDYAAIVTVAIVGVSLLYRGQVNLQKIKR